MPRLARLDAPGVLHHLMIRGIERRKIFWNDEDRADFLDRLATLLPETETCCYAWALLQNHAHLLLRSGKVPLATVMRRLLTGYAGHFNRRHNRSGHLFQNRYKSIVCQEDAYLRELVRYIHLNPIRARIVLNVSDLDHYDYCGHSALVGRKKRPWHDVDYVLRYFGEGLTQARKEYRAYMESGLGQGRRNELTGGGLIRSLGGWSEIRKGSLKGREHVKGDERILGNSEFVAEVLCQAEEKVTRKVELKRLGYDLSRISKRVAEVCRLKEDDILSKGKQQEKVKARSLLCFWAVRELGMSLTELARHLGLSVPAIGYSVERGERIAREHGYQLLE